MALAKHKEMRDLSKTDGKKRNSLKGIPKLNDANKAGTSQSMKCTLILTEGDSALATAIAGIGVVGRDYYGAFPLRGKLLNVREATASQLVNNAEINALKQILGLQQNKVYNNISELRYGKVLILTDADVDGSHIKGLIMNFFHYFWPSLFENDNFVSAMITPVLKLSRGQQRKEFYSLAEFKEWNKTHPTDGWSMKYYKGLGTSTTAEAKEYFKNMDKNVVNYRKTPESDDSLVLAFKKDKADNRKSWIVEGIVKNETLDYNEKTFGVDDFIHKDLIWFSIADVQRSIPSAIDGLKPSQRKVVYAGRKRGSNSEIKVSQFGSYVATETSYHHGEQSLIGTIVGMSQTFVGSNNYNLFEPNGQFGTRLMGGKDAASARYIFTRLSKNGISLFNKKDDPVLKYVEDDGKIVEPEYYVPLLPLVLVNGSEGIGTGYSCAVPAYNPKDIANNIRQCMNGCAMKHMIPWYQGFTGTIEDNENGTFTTHGVWKKTAKHLVEITELPIGRWTQDYKEFLDSLIDTKISNYENHCTESTVRFVLRMLVEFNPKDFKLTTSISTKNMHLFNHKQTITKYESPLEIINEFTQLRLKMYRKRKKHMMDILQLEQKILKNKVRFVSEIVDEQLVIFAKKKSDIDSLLNKNKYDLIDDKYDYLLNMKIYTFTSEKIDELKKQYTEKQTDVNWLESQSESDLMNSDLDSLKI